VAIIKFLLDKGMSVNLTNRDECKPLQVCVLFGHLEATKTLVERGATVNDTTKDVFTPLMVAAYNGLLEIFRYFREFCADINIRNAKNN